MPDNNKLLEALSGGGDKKNKVGSPKEYPLKDMPLLKAITQLNTDTDDEKVGKAIADSVRKGLASTKEVVSEGRVSSEGRVDTTKPVEAKEDGTVEGPYAPEVNAPGIVGEIAKDALVEDKARAAVDEAQRRGLRTVSSGYDEESGLGWAIAIDQDGNQVRVDAKPDPEDSVFDTAGALGGLLGDAEDRPQVQPKIFGTEGLLGSSDPIDPNNRGGQIPFTQAEKDAQFEREVQAELKRTAGHDPLSIAGMAAKDPRLQELIDAGTSKKNVLEFFEQRRKENEAPEDDLISLAQRMGVGDNITMDDELVERVARAHGMLKGMEFTPGTVPGDRLFRESPRGQAYVKALDDAHRLQTFKAMYPGVTTKQDVQTLNESLDVMNASMWVMQALEAGDVWGGGYSAEKWQKLKMTNEKVRLAKEYQDKVTDPAHANELIYKLKQLDEREFEDQRDILGWMNDVVGFAKALSFGMVDPSAEWDEETLLNMQREMEERGFWMKARGTAFTLLPAMFSIGKMSGVLKATGLKMGIQAGRAQLLANSTAMGMFSASQGGNFSEGFVTGFFTPVVGAKLASATRNMPVPIQKALWEAASTIGIGGVMHGFDVDEMVIDGLVGIFTSGLQSRKSFLQEVHDVQQAFRTSRTPAQQQAARLQMSALIQKVRVKAGADVDETLVLKTLSPTLEARVNRRVQAGENVDLAKAAEVEAKAILDAVENPAGKDIEDVASARAALNEVIHTGLGMENLAGQRGHANVGDLVGAAAHAAKESPSLIMTGLGIFPGKLIGPTLRALGMVERLAYKEDGTATVLGWLPDKAMQGVQRVAGKALIDLPKALGKAAQHAFGAVKGDSPEQVQQRIDRFKRWAWSAKARAGEQYAAILREMKAQQRFAGREVTAWDVHNLQKLDVKTRHKMVEAWEKTIAENGGKLPDDFGALFTENLDKVPGLPVNIEITNSDGSIKNVTVARALGVPKFVYNAIDSINQDLATVDPEMTPQAAGKLQALEGRSDMAKTLAMRLYMMRRLGFEPRIRDDFVVGTDNNGKPVTEKQLFDQAAKDQSTRFSLITQLANPDISLGRINEQLANVEIMKNVSGTVTQKMPGMDSAGTEESGFAERFAINYDENGQLRDRPLVRTTSAPGYSQMRSPILFGDAKTMWLREDIRTDFEGFSNDVHTWKQTVNSVIDWVRFSKVSASVGGTVRDMFGDMYMAYWDLGTGGISDIWRAGGLHGTRLEGLPTVREMITTARTFGEADIMIPVEQLGGGRRMVDTIKDVVRDGHIDPADFKAQLMQRLQAEMTKAHADQGPDIEWPGGPATADVDPAGPLSQLIISLDDMYRRQTKGRDLTEDMKARYPELTGEDVPFAFLRDWALSRHAFEQGVLANTFTEAELDLYRPHTKHTKFDDGILEGQLAARVGLHDHIISGTKKAFFGATDLTTRLRSLPDNYTKAGAWLAYLKRGQVDGEDVSTPLAAANRVASKYPTYDQIPHAFKTAGRLTGGIGANYFSEAMRITADAGRNHPWRLAFSVMAGKMMWGLNDMFDFSDLSDEEIEELQRENGMFAFPIPGTDRVIDMTPSMPLADMWNDTFFRLPFVGDPDRPTTSFGESGPANTGVQGIEPRGVLQQLGSYTKPFLAPFVEDNIPLGIGMTGLFGVDSFGNKLTDEERFLSRRGLPGFFEPSISRQIGKSYESLAEDTDKRGFDLDPLDVISQQAGFHIADQSEADLKKELQGLRFGILRARKELKSTIIKTNKHAQLSAAEKAEEKKAARDEFASLMERYKKRMDQVEKALEARKKRKR